MLTPDQSHLVAAIHRKIARLPHGATAPLTVAEVLRLINFLHLQDRAESVASERLQAILKRAAEEHLETLLSEPKPKGPEQMQLAIDS